MHDFLGQINEEKQKRLLALCRLKILSAIRTRMQTGKPVCWLLGGTDRERDVRERKEVINWTENEWRYDHHERILILSKAATLNGVECRGEGGGLLMSDFLAFP